MLSAFFDGEPVEPDLLATALREPGAAELLVEFARLRTAVQADTSHPTEEFCESMRETLERGDERYRPRSQTTRMSLAASLALAAALGGFGIRALMDRQQPAPERPVMQASRAPGEPLRPPARAPRSNEPPQGRRALPEPDLQLRFDAWLDTPASR
jgi:negative regulator of sigma E activity